jgi:hypothetical protein
MWTMSFPLKLLAGICVLFGFAINGVAASSSSVAPVRLRCEYRVDPLGIDVANPRLDWILQAVNPGDKGLSQSGYEVLVASSPDLLAQDKGDLWDSGKVASSQMAQIPYAGKPLASSEGVWWKVKVWDQSGAVSAWSPVAQWTMGVLTTADWAGAKWIAAPDANVPNNGSGPKSSYETVLLRREFVVRPGLRRALVHVCGLGQYEMTVNGLRADEDFKLVSNAPWHSTGGLHGFDELAPGWTWYDKTCLYNTYDITGELLTGSNAAGIFLGNGFYNIHKGRYTKVTGSFGPIQAIAMIRLEYQDGSVDTVVTDGNWKVASGPITFSSIYGGEDYDARLEQKGWDMPGFGDSQWEAPAITNGPGGTLKGLSAAGMPVRCFDYLLPISAYGKPVVGLGPVASNGAAAPPSLNSYARPDVPGVIVFDLGQNASILVALTAKGPAGSSIKVTPAELIKPDGDINDTMNHGNSYWTYTLSGKEDYFSFSHFYYRGARYLKVELRPAPGGTELPQLDYIVGRTIHADAPAVGQFSCSNELYNKIYTLIRWAQMNNMMSVLTDCPTREKLGWLEEDHLNGPALRYNFDVSTLMSKMVCDMADSQRPSGMVPSTCPNYLRLKDDNRFANPPEWGSACIIVPWQQYQFDGDKRLLGEHYDMMKRYVAFLQKAANGDIVNFGLGDWYDNFGFGAATLTPISLTATAFYYEDACILSDVAGMLGKPEDAATYKQLAGQILTAFNQKFFNSATNNYATGSEAANAVPLAMNMVDAPVRPEVLANLVQEFEAKHTTVGEVCLEFLLNALANAGRSDAIYKEYNSTAAGYGLQVAQGKTSLTEGWNGGVSQDHFMFGELNEWFFSHLAGIECDPAAPGFTKIVIRPSVVGDLTWVSASYDSISGKIVSEWRRDGTKVRLHVVIPPNTTAQVFLPGASAGAPREIGSGDYTFDANL